MNAAYFNTRIASLLPGLGFTVPIVSVQKGSARKESEAWNHNYIAAHLRMDNAPILAMGSKRAPACCRELRRSWGNRPSKSLLGDWGYGSDYQVLDLCQGNKLSMGRGNILLIQHENTNGEWTAAPKQQRQMAWPSASSWTVHLTTPVDSGENVCQ